MADSEQAKAALAALAEAEHRAGGGASDRTGHERDGSHEPAGTETAVRQASSTATRTDEGTAYRTVIERAVAATDDLDAAAEFVDSVGLDRLESAVETAEHEVSGLAEDGRAALATFERFRIAAEGPVTE